MKRLQSHFKYVSKTLISFHRRNWFSSTYGDYFRSLFSNKEIFYIHIYFFLEYKRTSPDWEREKKGQKRRKDFLLQICLNRMKCPQVRTLCGARFEYRWVPKHLFHFMFYFIAFPVLISITSLYVFYTVAFCSVSYTSLWNGSICLFQHLLAAVKWNCAVGINEIESIGFGLKKEKKGVTCTVVIMFFPSMNCFIFEFSIQNVLK